MNQKEVLKSKKAVVYVKSRHQKLVTCPHCWTDQRTERDYCYRCGAGFIYLDETVSPQDLQGIR